MGLGPIAKVASIICTKGDPVRGDNVQGPETKDEYLDILPSLFESIGYVSDGINFCKTIMVKEEVDKIMASLCEASKLGYSLYSPYGYDYKGEILEIGPAAIPNFVREFKSEDPIRKIAAVFALDVLGPKESYVPLFVKALKDVATNCPEDRCNDKIGHALAHIGPAAIPSIITLLNDKDWRVRKEAVHSLWYFKNSIAMQTVPVLVTMLTRDENKEVRRGIVDILGHIGPAAAPAVPALIQEFNNSGENIGYALRVARVFWRIGDPAALEIIPGLIEKLREVEATYDDLQLVKTIAQELVILHRLDKTASMTIFIKALKDKDWRVFTGVALALIDSVEEDAKDVDVKRLQEEVLPILVKALKNQDPRFRYAAAMALASLGKIAEPAAGALVEATKDPESNVAKTAKRALSNIYNDY